MNCYFNTSLGTKKIKVDIWIDPEATPAGSIYCLKFGYFKPMVEYVRMLDRPRSDSFDPVTKVWKIKNNRRNLFSLNLITKNDMVQKFLRPIEELHIPGFWKQQEEMYSIIKTRKTCILGGQMRIGKTLPTLAAIRNFSNGNAWIVSSKGALRGVQLEEKKWNITQNIKIKYFTYTKFRMHIQEMQNLSLSEGYLTVEYSTVNKETIPNFIVFDEMHHLKSPTVQVVEAAMQFSQWQHELYGWDNYYLVGLSGTPQPLNPGDWWAQVEIVCPGFIKEPNRMVFERRLGEFEMRESEIGQRYPHFKRWKKDELEKLYKRLKPLVFIFLKKDYMDLPAMQYEIVDLEPTKEMKRTIKLITKNSVNALVVLNKARQISDGFMYQYVYDEEKNIKKRVGYDFVGTPKVEQLNIDLDTYAEAADNGCGRIVIYAGFTGSLDIITEQCINKGWVVLKISGAGWEVITPDLKGQPYHTSIGLDRRLSPDDCLIEMDRSKDTGLISKLAVVANPEAGGEGNEFSASPVIIYYSNPNKGKARMQSEARCHSNNMDKKRGLVIKDYCLFPSDYKIRKTLMEKKDLQAITMGEIKGFLTEE